MSALAQPPFSLRTYHKFRKNPSFLHQKVWTSASEEPFVRKMFVLDNPLPLSADVLFGRPLLLILFWKSSFIVLAFN